MPTGIYKISNTIDNRIYIGSAISCKSRKRSHLSDLKFNKHGNGHIQNFFNKYGENALIFEVVETCNKENLIQREQYYIDTLNPEFNICKNAGNTLGRKFSDETKKKIALKAKGHQRRKGAILSKETRDKISKSNTGKKNSEEARKKMSVTRMGHPGYAKGRKIHTDESKQKISQKNTGKKFTEEHKRKISEGHKGKELSDITKEKLRIANTGRTHTEETKQKISQVHKGKVVSNKTRELMRINSTGRIHSEETRKKISKNNKGKIISKENREKTRQRMLGNKHTLGFKHTEETKKKMSESGKGKKRSDEHKRKTAEALRGRKRPKEVVDKIVAARKASGSYRIKYSSINKK